MTISVSCCNSSTCVEKHLRLSLIERFKNLSLVERLLKCVAFDGVCHFFCSGFPRSVRILLITCANLFSMAIGSVLGPISNSHFALQVENLCAVCGQK